MNWVKSTVPLPVFFAVFSMVCFALFDRFSPKKTFSIFIADPLYAAVASAMLGAVIGYLMGWFVVRKYKLPVSAMAYDVDAAFKAMKDENTTS